MTLKVHRDLIAAAERFEGVRAYTQRRGKHQVIDLHYQGRQRFVVVPVSPSDARGAKNSIRDIKRELRNLGVAA